MRPAVLLALLAAACGSPPPPERTPASDAVADSKTLREANAVAGAVVRLIGDCDAVKAAQPEALRKLDEIETRVLTAPGRTSLEALRKQVNDASSICP